MNVQAPARLPSPPTVHLVHGIHVTNGYDSIGKLKLYFHDVGFEKVEPFSYGFMPFFMARFLNPSVIEDLKAVVKPGDILVGHSNGGLLAYELAEAGVELGGVVLINPALDKDRRFAKRVPWIHVYFNEGDDVVTLARIPRLSSWGDMGKIGYRGPRDGRHRNIDCGRHHPKVDGHSDIFSQGNIELWGPRIAGNARRAWEKNANDLLVPNTQPPLP